MKKQRKHGERKMTKRTKAVLSLCERFPNLTYNELRELVGKAYRAINQGERDARRESCLRHANRR
jgi:hypothetical protein